ncbi:hypothetical protein GCM10029978_034420 [Actinoallomurus acanthiterrae]
MSTSSLAAGSALSAVTAAAFVIPAAWPLVAEMFEDQCDPEAILDSAKKWWGIRDDLSDARNTVRSTVAGLTPEEWKGEDRAAFERKMEDYEAQIAFEMAMATVVAVAMFILAAMLFILIALMVIIAAVMLWNMAYVLLAMAGLFTVAAAEATASQAAVTCFTYLDRLDTLEERIAKGLAGLVGAVMAVDVGGQLFKGNDKVLGDLLHGALDSVDNLLSGTLSRLERDLNKALMNGTKWPFEKFGFTPRALPRTAGAWGNATTWGGDLSLTPGNISDNLRDRLGDYDDGRWNR